MARNQAFAPSREPFQNEATADLQLQHSRIGGPFSFLNPTRASFKYSGPQQSGAASNGRAGTDSTDAKQHHGWHFLWRSRDNRKGRHPLVLTQSASNTGLSLPRRTNHPSEILKVVKRMFTYYPVWDISWLVAYIFTWGSIVWCINGFFSFLPLIRPSSEFSGEVLYGGGITAFIGAVLFFEVGSILLMLEAINENSAGCFGWAVEELAGEHGESKDGGSRLVPSTSHCTHHHPNRSNLVGTSTKHANMKEGKTWQWWPTLAALKTHYFHELGFLASFSQFCGATIFSIAGVTALPGIIDHMSQGLTDGIYWAPQVVGGSGFIVSGTLYMLETQKNWYTPSFGVLGWWIAFWNLIGGIGFTLCGALGFAAGSSGAQYQAALSTFWGSFVSARSSTWS
jgi:hypothetical protein